MHWQKNQEISIPSLSPDNVSARLVRKLSIEFGRLNGEDALKVVRLRKPTEKRKGFDQWDRLIGWDLAKPSAVEIACALHAAALYLHSKEDCGERFEVQLELGLNGVRVPRSISFSINDATVSDGRQSDDEEDDEDEDEEDDEDEDEDEEDERRLAHRGDRFMALIESLAQDNNGMVPVQVVMMLELRGSEREIAAERRFRDERRENHRCVEQVLRYCSGPDRIVELLEPLLGGAGQILTLGMGLHTAGMKNQAEDRAHEKELQYKRERLDKLGESAKSFGGLFETMFQAWLMSKVGADPAAAAMAQSLLDNMGGGMGGGGHASAPDQSPPRTSGVPQPPAAAPAGELPLSARGLVLRLRKLASEESLGLFDSVLPKAAKAFRALGDESTDEQCKAWAAMIGAIVSDDKKALPKLMAVLTMMGPEALQLVTALGRVS